MTNNVNPAAGIPEPGGEVSVSSLGNMGLSSHHQTKSPNVGSASLQPAKVEDVKSNLPRSQHNQPDQSQLPFLIQTVLLRANLRKSNIQQLF